MQVRSAGPNCYGGTEVDAEDGTALPRRCLGLGGDFARNLPSALLANCRSTLGSGSTVRIQRFESRVRPADPDDAKAARKCF